MVALRFGCFIFTHPSPNRSDESDEKGPQKSTNCIVKYPQIV